ncbi:MAG: energy transducer TonB, partial [Alistipes sp.]|nr:energy transducer TonB [Alistipes sp.]
VSFARFVARQIKWDDSDPTARVVLRYRIAEDGSLTILETLQSTDPRLKRRVEKVVEASPRWEPARKAGKAVATEGVLRLQLPEGKPLPRQLELVIR